LVFTPALVAKSLDIVNRGTVRRFGDEPGVIQESALRRSEAGFVEVTLENRGYALVIGSLNPQEVSVAVESIGTSVQVADVAGDHLLVAALEVALGEMNGVGEVHYLS